MTQGINFRYMGAVVKSLCSEMSTGKDIAEKEQKIVAADGAIQSNIRYLAKSERRNRAYAL